MMVPRILEVLILILTISYVLVILIISSIERSRLNSISNQKESPHLSASVEAVLGNIARGPVVDIKIIQANDMSACSSGEEKIFTWETVSRYCDCTNYVTRKHCSRGSSCRNRTRTSFSLTKWIRKRFCLTRLSFDDWQFHTDTFCAYGFKECSGGICVKEILECPITDVVVAEKSPQSNTGTYNNISFYSNGRSVFVSRDQRNAPFLSFDVGISGIPCINVKLGPTRKNQNTYPIIEQIPSGCDQYQSDILSFIPIESQPEWKLYEENLNLNYFNSLPGYREFVADETATLYARHKVQFRSDKKQCGSLDFSSLNTIGADASTLENLRLAANVLAFVLCSVCIILTAIFCIGISDGKFTDFSILIAVYSVFSLIMAIILIILCSISNNYIEAIQISSETLLELGDRDCFQINAYNILFDDFKTLTMESFEIEKSFNSPGLGLSITYFVIGFIYFVLKMISFYKE